MLYEPIYLDIDLSRSKPIVRQSCKRDYSSSSQICVNLAGFKAENVQINAEKNGKVTVNASKDSVEDSGRNGQRKTTVHVEQQFDLPEYILKEGLMDKITTKFADDKLCFQLPQKPVGTRIPINFEEENSKRLSKFLTRFDSSFDSLQRVTDSNLKTRTRESNSKVKVKKLGTRT